MTPIFITGGTGYMGKRLLKALVSRGYDVTALVRKGSERKLPKGVRAIIANPFDPATFQQWIPKGAVFVQLLGVPHPSPQKKDQFTEVDLRSVKASADAAAAIGASHFVYLSVAMTQSNVMKEYQAVRKEGEAYLQTKPLSCTFIRPWYVLGPGHWWPVLLLPFYGLAQFKEAWRKKAAAFSLVTLKQMLCILIKAIETPPAQRRIIEVQHIKKEILPQI